MSDPFVTSSADDADEMIAGRGVLDGTWSPDWIELGASAKGAQLYKFLRMRLNRRRRDRKVWPGLATLAAMMGFKSTESVTPYIKELKKLGAIDVRRTGMPAHNVYVINNDPPEGYQGPMCLEDWDADPANRALARQLRDADQSRADKSRGKPGRPGKKPQVSAVTGKNPEQAIQASDPAKPQVSPVTGKNPEQDTVKKSEHVPVKKSVEPLGVTKVLEVDLGATTSSTLDEPEDPQEKNRISSDDQHQEIDETPESVMKPRVLPTPTPFEEQLIEECLPLAGRRWSRLQLVKILGSLRVREITARDPELVRRAFLIGAACRQGVTVPMRMWHTDWCPHWSAAERELAAERSVEAGGVDAEAAPAKPVLVVAQPSRLQERPQPEGPAMSRQQALAHARDAVSRSSLLSERANA